MDNKIYKVLFLTKYSAKAPSSRYRSFFYEKFFIENGIKPIYKPLLSDLYVDGIYTKSSIKKSIGLVWGFIYRILFLFFIDLKKYDHIVIEKELFPNMPLDFDLFFLKKMKSFSLDFDDNISANYSGTKLKNKIPELMKLAKFVSVGNNWYKTEFQGNLIYLPTVIDLEKYPLYNFRQEDKKNEIVWMGSISTAKYLKLVEGILVRLSEKYDFVFRVIGAEMELDSRIKTKFTKWSEETENKDLVESIIGIMPLHNNYFELGKCGFKLIQYMASGIPVVASPLPANRDIVTEEVGFTADTEDEWYEKIAILLENTELRKKMGIAGRKRVEDHYSYQVWGKKYSEIIKHN